MFLLLIFKFYWHGTTDRFSVSSLSGYKNVETYMLVYFFFFQSSISSSLNMKLVTNSTEMSKKNILSLNEACWFSEFASDYLSLPNTKFYLKKNKSKYGNMKFKL